MDNDENDNQGNQSDSIENIMSDFTGLFAGQGEASQTAQAPEEEAQPVQATPEQEAPTQESEEKQALSPLLARYAEQERRAREELAQLEKSAESRVEQTKKQTIQELLEDPLEFAEKNQVSPEQAYNLALRWYAHSLGEDAPDELKQEIGMTDAQMQQKKMRQEWEQYKQQMQLEKQQAQLQLIADQYQGFLAEVPSSEFPYVAAESQHSQEEMYAAMAQVADSIAQERGRYPSAMEVAKLIENSLSETAARLSGINQQKQSVQNNPKVVETPQSNQTTTLSTQHSAEAGSTKKLPTGEDELFDEGLKWLEQNYKPLR